MSRRVLQGTQPRLELVKPPLLSCRRRRELNHATAGTVDVFPISVAESLLVDGFLAVRANHLAAWDDQVLQSNGLFVQEGFDQAIRCHVLPTMADKPKLTDLEKRMVAMMQSRGRLIHRNLTSWEKRSAINLGKKGIFTELPTNDDYFRTWTFTKLEDYASRS